MKKKRMVGILFYIVMLVCTADFVYELIYGNFSMTSISIILVAGIMGWMYISEKE